MPPYSATQVQVSHHASKSNNASSKFDTGLGISIMQESIIYLESINNLTDANIENYQPIYNFWKTTQLPTRSCEMYKPETLTDKRQLVTTMTSRLIPMDLCVYRNACTNFKSTTTLIFYAIHNHYIYFGSPKARYNKQHNVKYIYIYISLQHP